MNLDAGFAPAEVDWIVDLERRRELRLFLSSNRSRLSPDDVGLPRTSRRRVPRLRREEVTELIGVSAAWYRHFESGRPVRVSPQLIARFIGSLKLTTIQALTLFELALPEIYVVTQSVRTD